MTGKKKLTFFSLVIFVFLFIGYVLPGRHFFYPFLKFPMYGYSKTKEEMFRTGYETYIFFQGQDSLKLEDPFTYGFSRDVFVKEIIKPVINGDDHPKKLLLDAIENNNLPKKLVKIVIVEKKYKVDERGLTVEKTSRYEISKKSSKPDK